MLAPANFGSPLAHKGRSLLGRVVKGWKNEKTFQTGTHVLKGLELASPYSWDLAMRDRLGRQDYYGAGKTLATVLVGNTGYGGIASVANEAGSDGTVRVSTADLNCAYARADFSKDPHNPTLTYRSHKSLVPLGVMEGENHSTIACKSGGPKNVRTLPTILEALEVGDREFPTFRNHLGAMTRQTMLEGRSDSHKHGYQNTVVRVTDNFGSFVKDYFLEFYIEDDDTGWFEELFHRDAIRKVHAHSDNSSYRSVYVDCNALHDQVDKDTEGMKMSLTAMPEFSENGNVGYLTFTDDDIGGILLKKKTVDTLFKANRTLLVDIVLKRYQSKNVFRIKKL